LSCCDDLLNTGPRRPVQMGELLFYPCVVTSRKRVKGL